MLVTINSVAACFTADSWQVFLMKLQHFNCDKCTSTAGADNGLCSRSGAEGGASTIEQDLHKQHDLNIMNIIECNSGTITGLFFSFLCIDIMIAQL